MATFPQNPPPTSVNLTVTQPSATRFANNGINRQSKSSGKFIWEVSLSYSDLEFYQRDIIEAFLVDLAGMSIEFDIQIPTRSGNDTVQNLLGTSSANYAVNSTIIIIDGMVGAFKPNYLLRVNGKKATYMVVQVWPTISGSQQVRIKPPLRDALALGDQIITKNISLNVALDEDSVTSKSREMSSSISFKVIEVPK